MHHRETEHNFEHYAIMERLAQGHTTCPLTGWPLTADELEDNMDLEREIRQWRKQQEEPTKTKTNTSLLATNEHNSVLLLLLLYNYYNTKVTTTNNSSSSYSK